MMRFLMDTDGEGRWFVVPFSKRNRFVEYVEDETKNPADIPGVAYLNGHPNTVTFSSPWQGDKAIGGAS
jgi:hypothetical protein